MTGPQAPVSYGGKDNLGLRWRPAFSFPPSSVLQTDGKKANGSRWQAGPQPYR